MANEWIAPVATAVTGVAGVAFAWLTSRNTGRTQLELIRTGHRQEMSRELRHERRECYAALLNALDAVEALLQTEAAGLDAAIKSAGLDPPEQPSEVGAGGDEPGDPSSTLAWSSYAHSCIDVMEPDVRAGYDAITERLFGELREFDKVFQDALLCGGDEVLEAVYPVRSDLIDALYQTVWSGEHRLVDGTLRLALLAAMRQDLGYEDRGPEKERE